MKSAFFLVLYVLAASPAIAGKPSAALQVELQNVMLSYTDSILVDGSYSYLDTKNRQPFDRLSRQYPSVRSFVRRRLFCLLGIHYRKTEIRLLADYLVRQIGEKYSVVQMILNDRDSLKKSNEEIQQEKEIERVSAKWFKPFFGVNQAKDIFTNIFLRRF